MTFNSSYGLRVSPVPIFAQHCCIRSHLTKIIKWCCLCCPFYCGKSVLYIHHAHFIQISDILDFCIFDVTTISISFGLGVLAGWFRIASLSKFVGRSFRTLKFYLWLCKPFIICTLWNSSFTITSQICIWYKCNTFFFEFHERFDGNPRFYQ